jgi:chromosome segregation ATPase
MYQAIDALRDWLCENTTDGSLIEHLKAIEKGIKNENDEHYNVNYELEELEQTVEQLKSEIESLKAEIEHYDVNDELETKVKELKQTVERLESEIESLNEENDELYKKANEGF